LNSFCKIITKDRVSVDKTLCSGQTFLWDVHADNKKYYSSVIHSVPVIIRQLSENEICITASENEIGGLSIEDFFYHYLALDIDSQKVFPENFCRLYPDIWHLLGEYFPLRILRQPPFETMISFMCAQGIGMRLIRNQVSMLKQTYGEQKSICFSGEDIIMHQFPSPERLASADPIALSRCTNNNRFRARNIIHAAQGVAEGRIDLDSLCRQNLPLSELRNTLCRNGGIGYKIADCIALFGLGRFDAFPIDTHVKQYLGKWFNSITALRSLSPASYLVLDAEARSFLNSDLAGYAGHILFHCWRKEIKKLLTF
jgi:N-glycosylase/DNA lyase